MSYLSTILADSPSIVYKFDEASGAVITDYSTAADAGAVIGTVAYRFGGPVSPDPAMGFTTSADAVKNTNTLNFAVATVEVWAKIPAIPGALSQVVGFVQANNTAISDKDIMIRTNGTLRFYGFDGGVKTIDGARNVADNSWHHLVGTANGTTISIYVDGVSDATPVACGNTFAGYAAGQPSVQFGGSQTGHAAVWQSQNLAYGAIYNTALSPARILAHYQAAAQPSLLGLISAGSGAY